MRTIPIVIVEGCDGAGKSSLADELRAMWLRIKQPERGMPPTATLSHNGPPPDRLENESPAEYSLRLQSRLVDQVQWYDHENSMHLHVVDRCHVGSYVYGNLFRTSQSLDGWGELGRAGFARVDRAYAAKGAVMAVLAPSPDALVIRSGTREDEYLDEVIEHSSDVAHSTRRMRQIIEISQMYDVFLRQHAPLFETYAAIGHPYYVPLDYPHGDISERWPDIAYEQDRRTVAANILGRAIDAQLSAMSNTKMVLVEHQNGTAAPAAGQETV